MNNDRLEIIALLYGHESANSLREVIELDQAFAESIIGASLDPRFLEEKHRVDKSERAIEYWQNH